MSVHKRTQAEARTCSRLPQGLIYRHSGVEKANALHLQVPEQSPYTAAKEPRF